MVGSLEAQLRFSLINARERLREKLARIVQDDGTYFGDGAEKETKRKLDLIQDLLGVFDA